MKKKDENKDKKAENKAEVKKVSSSDLMDSEYLDIPSFVKKQID